MKREVALSYGERTQKTTDNARHVGRCRIEPEVKIIEDNCQEMGSGLKTIARKRGRS